MQIGAEGTCVLVLSTDNGVLCKFAIDSHASNMEYELCVDLESGLLLPFCWLHPSNQTLAQASLPTTSAPGGRDGRAMMAPTTALKFDTGELVTVLIRLVYQHDGF